MPATAPSLQLVPLTLQPALFIRMVPKLHILRVLPPAGGATIEDRGSPLRVVLRLLPATPRASIPLFLILQQLAHLHARAGERVQDALRDVLGRLKRHGALLHVHGRLCVKHELSVAQRPAADVVQWVYAQRAPSVLGEQLHSLQPHLHLDPFRVLPVQQGHAELLRHAFEVCRRHTAPLRLALVSLCSGRTWRSSNLSAQLLTFLWSWLFGSRCPAVQHSPALAMTL
mmetsp:Transcript_17140/g.30632  ORF Transcript_17140/g.30632 Transcript_17140/m.30632 type:complete len:228 (+) Transcript_17140:1517-2200(+)